MTDEAQVLQWCMQDEVLKEVWKEWQRDLLHSESQETYTPSLPTSTPTSESQWSAETPATAPR